MSTFELDDSTVASTDGLAPRRLFEGGGDAFERSLLEPGRSTAVPQASLERLARALHLPPEAIQLPPEALPPAHALDAPTSTDVSPAARSPAAVSSAAVSSAVTAGRGAWLAPLASRRRLGAVSMVVVGAGLAGLRAGWGGGETPAPAPAAAVSTIAPIPAPTEPEPEPAASSVSATPGAFEPPATALAIARAPVDALPATPRPRADAMPARAGTPRRPLAQRALGAAAASSMPLPSSGLGAELRALEAVQRALWEHQPDAAARALVEYDQRFARGELRLEADLLGVEVALARGQRSQARSRAIELAALPAAARYRDRLATLLAATENTNGTTLDGAANPRASHINGAEVSR